MPNIPSNLSYGTVGGRFIVAYQDSADSGSEPDAIAASGSIFFTPSITILKDVTASPDPVSVLPVTVEATLDSEGYLCGYGTTRGINLIATDDPQGNPVNWTWRAEFRLTDQSGESFAIEPFSFSLPSGGSVNLTTAAPVPDANGTFYNLGTPGDWSSAQFVNELSSNITLTSTNAGQLITNSAPITVTVQGLASGQEVNFLQTASGQITFQAGAGVTLSSKNAKLKTAQQWSAAYIKCLGSTYVLIGDIGD